MTLPYFPMTTYQTLLILTSKQTRIHLRRNYRVLLIATFPQQVPRHLYELHSSLILLKLRKTKRKILCRAADPSGLQSAREKHNDCAVEYEHEVALAKNLPGFLRTPVNSGLTTAPNQIKRRRQPCTKEPSSRCVQWRLCHYLCATLLLPPQFLTGITILMCLKLLFLQVVL